MTKYKRNSKYRYNERGNVLVLILVAVALFAALSFTVADIMRTGDPQMIGDQQAYLFADEILDYSRAMRQTVQGLRIDGCGDTDISFENPVESGYVNGTNTNCQVFHPDGGGLKWVSPQANFNDGSEWYITGSRRVVDIGTTSHLILILPNIRKVICQKINERTEIGDKDADPPTELGYVFGFKFTGTYLSGGGFGDDAGGADLRGKPIGCFQSTSNPTANSYHFYQVLYGR